MTIPEYNGTGVYTIKNLHNGKLYIGKSKNITTRIQCHISALNSNCHNVHELQKDYNSGDKFEFQILKKILGCNSEYLQKAATTFEYEYITDYNPEVLYNKNINPPYIWNTLCDIPEEIRSSWYYQKGDVFNEKFQKYLITDDNAYFHTNIYKLKMKELLQSKNIMDIHQILLFLSNNKINFN